MIGFWHEFANDRTNKNLQEVPLFAAPMAAAGAGSSAELIPEKPLALARDKDFWEIYEVRSHTPVQALGAQLLPPPPARPPRPRAIAEPSASCPA